MLECRGSPSGAMLCPAAPCLCRNSAHRLAGGSVLPASEPLGTGLCCLKTTGHCPSFRGRWGLLANHRQALGRVLLVTHSNRIVDIELQAVNLPGPSVIRSGAAVFLVSSALLWMVLCLLTFLSRRYSSQAIQLRQWRVWSLWITLTMVMLVVAFLLVATLM